MEILTMITWLLVAPLSLLLGAGVVVLGRISLGLQVLAGLGGATLMILYVFLEGPAGLAWGAAGLAVFGLLIVLIAAVGLVSDGGLTQTAGSQSMQEFSAGLAGVLLPMFGVVAILSIATAINGAATF